MSKCPTVGTERRSAVGRFYLFGGVDKKNAPISGMYYIMIIVVWLVFSSVPINGQCFDIMEIEHSRRVRKIHRETRREFSFWRRM